MVKWWAGHVPPPHKTLLCFLLPQHTAGIPPKKTKRFHTIYRVRLDCRRKCIFLTCDYKAHVCSTQKTSGLTLSQLFMMHTACETLICIWSWRLIFYIENGSWVWSYPEIETCTFYQLQHMCMPNELLFNVPASTYTIHKSWSGSYELLFKVRLVSSWSSINNSLIKV